ncbi:hypothetical protein Aglo02_06070 [Actinokineospora globicatena]|nr:hypothetical protein Aglo02_06070 [Actinokineospora globicatena]
MMAGLIQVNRVPMASWSPSSEAATSSWKAELFKRANTASVPGVLVAAGWATGSCAGAVSDTDEEAVALT